MKLSEFAFRMLLIFIPGLISYILTRELTVKTDKDFKPFNTLIFSLILGFFNYVIFYLIIQFINLFLDNDIQVYFFKSLINQKVALHFEEIIYVSIISIAISFLLIYTINNRWLFRLGNKISISDISSQLTVWNDIMNYKKKYEWLIIRDKENNIMYEGFIDSYSDDYEKNEVFLTNVKVYQEDTGVELYEVDGIYLCTNKEKLVFELKQSKVTEGINNE